MKVQSAKVFLIKVSKSLLLSTTKSPTHDDLNIQPLTWESYSSSSPVQDRHPSRNTMFLFSAISKEIMNTCVAGETLNKMQEDHPEDTDLPNKNYETRSLTGSR